MTASKRKKIYFYIFWVIMVASFVFFAVILIAFANGYHINMKNFHLQKTGIIIVDGNIDNALVSINGKTRISGLPCEFTRLLPGRYEIKVSKANYQDWSKIVYLEGGQATTLNDVTLYFNKIVPIKASDAPQALARARQTFQNQSANISLENNEIHYQQKLITRFSQNIGGAIYDGQTNHFYFQQQNEIRAIDFDGSNNVLLFKLPSDAATAFYVNNNLIYYIDAGKLYQANIY